MQGDPGNDSLNGNAGNDVLFGDTLVPSEVGSHAFSYNTAQGSDCILNFVNSRGSTGGENDGL